MTYEKLIMEVEKEVEIKEKPLKYGFKGLYKNSEIIIDKNIKTSVEKKGILAEELGHHYTTSGNILDQSNIVNRKQEKRARVWGYERLVSIDKLVAAVKYGVRNRFELSKYLDVTEEYIEEVIKYYKGKYGLYYKKDNYIIYFEPLAVFEAFE